MTLAKYVYRIVLLVFVGAGALSLRADSEIYEPFDMTTNTLSGQEGGYGLKTWTGSGGSVATGSMSYGSLSTSGNRYSGSGGYEENWVDFSQTLDNAKLLDHGATLWFSLLLQPGSGANDYGFFGFSSATGDLGANFVSVPPGANVLGIWLQNGSDLNLVDATNGVPVGGRETVKDNLSLVTPTFVVGKCVWGADASSNDTLEVYLPGTDLVEPASPTGASLTTVIDQSTFSYLGLWMRNLDSQVDEIRIGPRYQDVLRNPEADGTLVILQ